MNLYNTGTLKHSLELFYTTAQIGRDFIYDLAQPFWGCIFKTEGYHIASQEVASKSGDKPES